MTRNKRKFTGFLFILLSFLLFNVQSYPTGRDNIIFTKLDPKSENHYINGTVVGNYKYVDKEGNPVHVKYYANNAGYGVELKSVKVLDAANDQTVSHTDKPQKLDNMYPSLLSSDFLNDYQNTVSGLGNSSNHKIRLDSDKSKANFKETHYKHETSPDYEIYLQNEVLAPKCGKGKVRIYIDKDKRKIREVLNDVVTFKHFDQM